jgi:hypothetical protein
MVAVSADLERAAGWLPNSSTTPMRVWSNVDVKGFARSAVPLLAAAGVKVLYVGANGGVESPSAASHKGLQPVVGPRNAAMFRWIDPPSGKDIVVIYHAGYVREKTHVKTRTHIIPLDFLCSLSSFECSESDQ